MRTRESYLRFLATSIPAPKTPEERWNLIEALATTLVAVSHVHSGAKYCAYEQVETVANQVLDKLHEAFHAPLGDKP